MAIEETTSAETLRNTRRALHKKNTNVTTERERDYLAKTIHNPNGR